MQLTQRSDSTHDMWWANWQLCVIPSVFAFYNSRILLTSFNISAQSIHAFNSISICWTTIYEHSIYKTSFILLMSIKNVRIISARFTKEALTHSVRDVTSWDADRVLPDLNRCLPTHYSSYYRRRCHCYSWPSMIYAIRCALPIRNCFWD